MIIQPQVGPADDRAPRQRAHRVQVLRTRHEHAVLRSIVTDVLPRLHGSRREGLIIAHGLPPQGQRRRQEQAHRRKACQHPATPQTLQPPPHLRQPIADRHGTQQIPQVEQLIIIVLIGLKTYQLRRDKNCKGACGDTPGAAVLFRQSAQQRNERQTDILDIEPQVEIPHSRAPGIIDPVELELQKGAAHARPRQRLTEGKADQLRRGQRHGNAAIQEVALHLLCAFRVMESVVEHHARRAESQRKKGMGMDQRQRTAPHAQQGYRPSAAQLRTLAWIKGCIQQIKAGNDHAVSAQQGTLGHQQVSNEVTPAQVIGFRLIGGRFIIALQNIFQPCQHRQRAVALEPCRLIEVIQKAQTAVQKEQHRRQQDGFLAQRHFPRQQQHTQIAQSHHECAGDDDAHLQTPPHQIKGGGQAVRQEGIRQPLTGKNGVIRRELCVLQGGNEGQVHGEVAIGALTYVIGTVRRDADGMGILQISGEHGQRQHKQQRLPKLSCFLRVPRFRAALIPCKVSAHGQQDHGR